MLIAHLVACAFMTGIIWIIQVLHYPAFLSIDVNRFGAFHALHSSRMGYLVGPVMVFELITGVLLVMNQPRSWPLMANLGLIVGLWLLTFLVSVPLHNFLATSLDPQKIEALIMTNWPRTILWNLRLLILLGIVYAA